MTSDLGLWRCDLESEEDIYFGFLSVLCPWAMRDPEVAAAVIAGESVFRKSHRNNKIQRRLINSKISYFDNVLLQRWFFKKS